MILLSDGLISKPVIKLTDKLKEESPKPTFLFGQRGSGKTTVLNYYKGTNVNHWVDISLEDNEKYHLYNDVYFKTYHLTLVVKKVLLFIEQNYPSEFKKYFLLFNARVLNLLNLCRVHSQLGAYYNIQKDDLTYITDFTGEKLIQDFLTILMAHFNELDLTLIIDNFDGVRSEKYQRIIYDTLKNYFHLLLSVTDEKVLDLDSNNRLILVGYNTDVNTLYEILNANLLKERILSLKEIETYGLHKLISHWAMKELISKTNGNITMMKIAINVLYNTYNPRDIDDNVLLNTLSKRVSVDSEIVRQTFGKRTLYIK